jgi:hypothetical protein
MGVGWREKKVQPGSDKVSGEGRGDRERARLDFLGLPILSTLLLPQRVEELD